MVQTYGLLMRLENFGRIHLIEKCQRYVNASAALKIRTGLLPEMLVSSLFECQRINYDLVSFLRTFALVLFSTDFRIQ
jgi:hypothetical protein